MVPGAVKLRMLHAGFKEPVGTSVMNNASRTGFYVEVVATPILAIVCKASFIRILPAGIC